MLSFGGSGRCRGGGGEGVWAGVSRHRHSRLHGVMSFGIGSMQGGALVSQPLGGSNRSALGYVRRGGGPGISWCNDADTSVG